MSSRQRDTINAMPAPVSESEPGGDFLDEMIEWSTREDPLFPELMHSAVDRRRIITELRARRVSLGLSQTAVAAELRTSQSAIARLETAAADTKLSTLQRYATAVGLSLNLSLEPSAPAEGNPST
ncbi:MAG: helix-turn-helix transcriptional regulator [Actinomycetes bacterium]